MPSIRISRGYAVVLSLLLFAFCLRVCAQLLQAVYSLGFIPSFAAWDSGLLPYGVLLPSQVVIIAVGVNIIANFYRGKAIARGKIGKYSLAFGAVYFSVMFFRLLAGLTFARDWEWLGAEIPPIFHLALASFLLVYGRYHYKYGRVYV